jgi:hypothetical protein
MIGPSLTTRRDYLNWLEMDNNWTSKALVALERAAKKVAEAALAKNTPIPIWEDGHLVRKLPPKKLTSQRSQSDPLQSRDSDS